jgi:hypothetical protein
MKRAAVTPGAQFSFVRFCLRERLVAGHGYKCIERRIQLLDLPQAGLGEFHRREPSAPQHLAGLLDAQPGGVI